MQCWNNLATKRTQERITHTWSRQQPAQNHAALGLIRPRSCMVQLDLDELGVCSTRPRKLPDSTFWTLLAISGGRNQKNKPGMISIHRSEKEQLCKLQRFLRWMRPSGILASNPSGMAPASRHALNRETTFIRDTRYGQKPPRNTRTVACDSPLGRQTWNKTRVQ